MLNLRFIWVLVCGLLFSPFVLAVTNQLKENPSPYLALHGQDPVAWQEWNADTVALARKQNKMLFVSIGYYSCHWCHVMQRESYRNPEIAAALNKNYIPVKVDRELMGALDTEMQTFAQRTRSRSGWPLNVFITPEGHPLYATLYSPPGEFLSIINRLNDSWVKDSVALKTLAKKSALPQTKVAKANEAIFSPELVEHYRSKLIDVALQRADIFRGGFGATNKFPMSPQLSALLEAYVQEPQPALADFLKLTLNQMINQGLRDHVGGGFFRYTTDPDWHTPHFEKMLYDNAQLARLYLRAADVLEMPDYREQAYAILDFILTDLREEKVRGLMTSTSAIDEKSVEGGVYLWDKHELQTHLSSNEYALVEKIWGLNTPQEFEAGYLPIQKVMPTMEERAALVLIIGKLKAIRSSRSLPKDQKRLASLNGLALIALSEAAQHETRYLAAATEIKHFLVNEMWHGNALYKARSKEKYLGTGELEDYAYAAAGMLSYARLTGAKVDMDAARQMTQQGWHRFHINAAWKLQQSTLLGNQSVEAVVADSSSPSPASVLIAVSWQMPDKALRTQALAALNAGHAELEHDIFWYATQVAAMMALQPMTQKKPQ